MYRVYTEATTGLEVGGFQNFDKETTFIKVCCVKSTEIYLFINK